MALASNTTDVHLTDENRDAFRANVEVRMEAVTIPTEYASVVPAQFGNLIRMYLSCVEVYDSVFSCVWH